MFAEPLQTRRYRDIERLDARNSYDSKVNCMFAELLQTKRANICNVISFGTYTLINIVLRKSCLKMKNFLS